MAEPSKKTKRLVRIFIGAALGTCAALTFNLVRRAQLIPNPAPPTYYYEKTETTLSQNQSDPENGLMTEIRRAVLLKEGPARMLREFDKWARLYTENPANPERVETKIREYRDLFGIEVEQKVRNLVPPYMRDERLIGQEFLTIAIELGKSSGTPHDPKFLPQAAAILAKYKIDDTDGKKAQNLVSAACYTVSEARKMGSNQASSTAPKAVVTLQVPFDPTLPSP